MMPRWVWVIIVFVGAPLLPAMGMISCRRPSSADGGAAGAQTRPTRPAQRLIALAPNIAEIAFALGVGDRVVGVSTFCNYPPEARTKVQLGGWIDTDNERILALRPDLIILPAPNESLRRLCQENNIEVVPAQTDTLGDLYKTISIVGDRMGCVDRANRLISGIKDQLHQITEAVRTAAQGRPTVFLSISRNPGQPLGQLLTPGKTSFLTDIVDMVGGRNLFADMDNPYPQVSLETVVGRRPEMIIEMMPEATDTAAIRKQVLKQWQALDAIPAVRQQRVYVLTADYTLVPGPRVANVARLLAETIHPEVKLD